MSTLRFKIAGFPIEILPNAWFLAGIFLLFALSWGWSVPIIVATIGIAAVSVIFHELGHATSARWFGLEKISITLHGFGGLTRHPATGSAGKELIIVLAGPAAGLLLAALAFAVSLLPLPDAISPLVGLAVTLNVIWSLFNLLPIFPMDGGQALGNGLALVIEPATAWPVTWGIGLLGALGLGLLAWSAGEIFILFFAGMFAYRNWQLLAAWRSRSKK